MEPTADFEVLDRWHAAVNAGDVDAALACCSDDVAVTGPRGTGTGKDLMEGWLRRSGIRLQPQGEPDGQNGRYVVSEQATWTVADPPPGAGDDPIATWVVFTVADGLVTSVARYDSEDEVPPG